MGEVKIFGLKSLFKNVSENYLHFLLHLFWCEIIKRTASLINSNWTSKTRIKCRSFQACLERIDMQKISFSTIVTMKSNTQLVLAKQNFIEQNFRNIRTKKNLKFTITSDFLSNKF